MDKKPNWRLEDLRRSLYLRLDGMLKEILALRTDALLPARIIIEDALSSIRELATDYPYLIDNEFRREIRQRLQAIARDILACEIATGQRHTHERRIIENADRAFLTCSMISEG